MSISVTKVKKVIHKLNNHFFNDLKLLGSMFRLQTVDYSYLSCQKVYMQTLTRTTTVEAMLTRQVHFSVMFIDMNSQQ